LSKQEVIAGSDDDPKKTRRQQMFLLRREVRQGVSNGKKTEKTDGQKPSEIGDTWRNLIGCGNKKSLFLISAWLGKIVKCWKRGRVRESHSPCRSVDYLFNRKKRSWADRARKGKKQGG